MFDVQQQQHKILTNEEFSCNEVFPVINRAKALKTVPSGTILKTCLQTQYCITTNKQQTKSVVQDLIMFSRNKGDKNSKE